MNVFQRGRMVQKHPTPIVWLDDIHTAMECGDKIFWVWKSELWRMVKSTNQDNTTSFISIANHQPYPLITQPLLPINGFWTTN